MNNINKMNKTEENKKQFKCHQCKSKPIFKTWRGLEKHCWMYHPANDIERTWARHAREGFENWTGSSYYESYGPYY